MYLLLAGTNPASTPPTLRSYLHVRAVHNIYLYGTGDPLTSPSLHIAAGQLLREAVAISQAKHYKCMRVYARKAVSFAGILMSYPSLHRRNYAC